MKKPAEVKRVRKSVLTALPSKTHMGMVELVDKGHLKFIISQNTDGMHRRSGIHASNLSELHGNTNLEVCKDCGREHMRDYRVRNSTKHGVHDTGRKCNTPGCGGNLADTGIAFGENLNPNILDLGF